MDRAREASSRRAGSAEDEGRGMLSGARTKGELADLVGRDRSRLANELGLARSTLGDDTARMNAVNAVFSKPYQVSKEYSDMARSMGLNSNRDLWEKGEKVQNQLNERAQADAQKAAQELQSARQAQGAVQRLEEMQNIQNRRVGGLKSIDPEAKIPSGKPLPSGEGPIVRNEKSASSELIDARSSGKLLTPGSSATAFLANLDSELNAARKSPELANRLRNRLREALARALNSKDEKTAKTLKEKLSQLDARDGSVPSTPHNAGESMDGPREAFSMKNSETDRAVHELLQDLSGKDGRFPASAVELLTDISIFERVKRPIRDCLSSNCVAWQH